MGATETSISNPPPNHTSAGGFYNKHTCREVSPELDASLGEFGKLPATRGASNPGLTEPTSMFGFYHMPFR